LDTFLFLGIDGLTSGAIYALLAVSLVLVQTVTRVVNIAQGEYLMLGAMTLASLLDGDIPPTLGLVLTGAILCLAADIAALGTTAPRQSLLAALRYFLLAALALTLVYVTLHVLPGTVMSMATTLVLVTLTGPIIYRLSVRPKPEADAVVLVIVSVGVQMVVHGLALILWGAEPRPVAAAVQGGMMGAGVFVSWQAVAILVVAGLATLGLYAFFELTLAGKALRAASVSRRGAQLCGIAPERAGAISFALGAGLSALGGMLVAPLVTANVDIGFVVGLKAFVGATFGGLVTYPLALAGVSVVGLLDSFSAYAASGYRDAIVFMLVIPIMLWRSGQASQRDGHWDGDR
jgi:branched-chain amino acid transport system permease protein